MVNLSDAEKTILRYFRDTKKPGDYALKSELEGLFSTPEECEKPLKELQRLGFIELIYAIQSHIPGASRACSSLNWMGLLAFSFS
jgi:hypothetical protein